MSNRCDGAPDVVDDVAREALTDHHLDEVAEMIEQAQAEAQSVDSPSDDTPADYLATS